MSGGERKKRTPRGTGWEEAGGEFFQESYPGAELDLEALPRDPHYLATLLPSKQTRAATTRKPSKVDNKATYRRRTSTRQRNTNTMGQNTMPNDIHVAMMPDLSENLANEETTWEEMMLIKAMPVTMAQKREIKAKLLSADTFRLQGLRRFKWRRRKLLEYLKVKWKEAHKQVELWRDSFQSIESRFGPAVATFFAFIKWLVVLNIAMAILTIMCIVMPTIFMQAEQEECYPSNSTSMSLACCSQRYFNNSPSDAPTIFELLEGSGWLEQTAYFYGMYPYTLLHSEHASYNLPIAYMTTIVVVYIMSLAAIMKAGSSGFKEKLLEGEGQYYKFCSLIFSSWDFCLRSDKGASAKHKALFLEMKEWIEEERREDDTKNQTRDEVCRTLLVRLSMNLLIKIILIAGGSLVYFAVQLSIREKQNHDISDEYHLLLEYAPALCVVGLNLAVPNILQYLVTLEGYSPTNTMRINLVRQILLRFLTLGVLLISVTLVQCDIEQNDECVSTSCSITCWETYIGQQFYKLLLLHTVVQIAITFLINFPRTLLAKHVRCKLARIVGLQEFDIIKHLIDVIYVQLLVWGGSFFMPLLPLKAALVLIITFYLKKFACLVNSVPSSTALYRVSKSWSLYLFVLLGTFVGVIMPLGYTVLMVQPSKICGPFRGLVNYWSLIERTYRTFPSWLRNTMTIVTSSAVAFPVLIFLFLLFYYYYIVTVENRQMVIVLKKQLVLEGHDKQFLLNRLSAFIKQHQERHKPARSIDPPPANSA